MASFKLTLLLSIVAFVSACSQAPGTTVTTVTTSVTTVSMDDENQSGLLSSSDRSIIRKTWDQAKRDGDVAPKVLFRFVKAHPEYQKKFSKFANVPQAEMMTNGNFLAQAYTILAGLNVVIQSLSSQELMAGQLNALGGAHQPRGVTPAMFEEFGVILEQVLEEELGNTFSTEARQAWKNGITALVVGVSKTLKNPEDLVDPQTKLSPHQIRDVQRSWENIRAGRNSMVTSIFVNLFKETPRIQKYFAKFANVPVESLKSNGDFNKQVALVADRLDAMISAMGDKLQLLGNINYMRYTHMERGIPRGPWEDFGRLLIEFLAAKGVSSDDLDSWKGTLSVFLNGIAPKN
ncbi:Hemoglobin [Daphnia magna]|uniref:Hemoglobin n=1 Tax=Daphnia magna TaxID=35525 RepID=A0A165AF90_9CRUS|nr:Hemoglobin [Daphnia magna]